MSGRGESVEKQHITFYIFDILFERIVPLSLVWWQTVRVKPQSISIQ